MGDRLKTEVAASISSLVGASVRSPCGNAIDRNRNVITAVGNVTHRNRNVTDRSRSVAAAIGNVVDRDGNATNRFNNAAITW